MKIKDSFFTTYNFEKIEKEILSRLCKKELTFAEIAEIVGISERGVYRRMQKYKLRKRNMNPMFSNKDYKTKKF